MGFRDVFRGVGDATKGLANATSNLTVSGLQTIKGLTRAALLVGLVGVAPVAAIGYKVGTELAKKLPRGIGQKYQAIHDKTLGQIEKVFSLKGALNDIKEGFSGTNHDIFAVAGDGKTAPYLQAQTEIAKAKLTHKHEMGKAKLENEKEIRKENIKDRQQRRQTNSEITKERIKNRESNRRNMRRKHQLNRLAENNKLTQHIDDNNVTRHTAEQETARNENNNNTKIIDRYLQEDTKQYTEEHQTARNENTNRKEILVNHRNARKDENISHMQEDTKQHTADQKTARTRATAAGKLWEVRSTNNKDENVARFNLQLEEAKERNRKAEEKAAKRKETKENNDNIRQVISRINAMITIPPTIYNAEQYIQNANNLLTELNSQSTGNKVLRTDMGTANGHLVDYINGAQEIIDTDKVDKAEIKANKILTVYYATHTFNPAQFNTVNECDTIIRRIEQTQNTLPSLSAITTPRERTRLDTVLTNLDTLKTEIINHKESNNMISMPDLGIVGKSKEPVNSLSLRTTPNSHYKIEILDQSNTIVDTIEFDSNTRTQVPVALTSGTELQYGKYTINYTAKNFKGEKNNSIVLNIDAPDMAAPTISIDQTGNPIMHLDNLIDTDELDIKITNSNKTKGKASKIKHRGKIANIDLPNEIVDRDRSNQFVIEIFNKRTKQIYTFTHEEWINAATTT